MKFSFNKSIAVVFVITVIYWVYLIFSTQMAIICDANSYEVLGKMIYEKGWKEFFITGPNREPLYPFTIAFSMKLAGYLSIPYYYLQKIIQVLILFFTQLSVLYFLNKLKVNKRIVIAAVLYTGVSPAIVNSGFCLFSEIAALPPVILIVAASAYFWENLHKASIIRAIIFAATLAALFFWACLAKGIFQYVFWFFIVAYIFQAAGYIKNKKNRLFLKTAVFVCSTIIIFSVFLAGYKSLNLKYNGKFEFTDRFGELLYGNAVKRSQKLNPRMIVAHIASIPGYGVAEKLFSVDEARYSGFQGADGFRPQAAGLTNKQCIEASRKLFLSHPFQYVFFMGVEGLRMFFWETTRLGFVSYPAWLETVFSFTPFKSILRLIISLLTIISFLWLFKNIVLLNNEKRAALGFILLLVISYTALHTFFSVVARYSIVIAPFFIITIACFLDNLLIKGRGG